MKVTNKITIHLDDLREIRPVDVMQCDVHTRELEIALFAGGKKWEIPNSVTPVISYRKPDGTKGLYDTLPNGNPACRIEANVVRAVLPPSALEAPGRVDLALIFTDDDDNQLAAFGVPVDVHRNPGVGAVASGDYFNLQKWVKETAVAAVPKALPNPQKLILTGAVETEYDGSGEVKVEIPVGGSKDVHIGSEPPTNGEAIWINPDEEPEGDDVSLEEVVSQVVDNCVPDWAKQPEKPKYTAAEVGALPADTPIPEGVTDEQIKNAVGAYLTENPPEGGGIPIPSSAQVGQTIVVKAVDETGKPTEWEAADFPSGGGEISSYTNEPQFALTVEEDCASILLDTLNDIPLQDYGFECVNIAVNSVAVAEAVNGTFTFRVNHDPRSNVHPTASISNFIRQAASKWWGARFDFKNRDMCWGGASSPRAIDSISSMKYMMPVYIDSLAQMPIKNIYFAGSSDQTIPAGTKIYIWLR